MSFPIINQILIAEYGWRGGILITSAITMNIAIAAFFMHNKSNNPKNCAKENEVECVEKSKLSLEIIENAVAKKSAHQIVCGWVYMLYGLSETCVLVL